MKSILALCIVAILLTSCESKEKLDRKTVLSILKEENTYPKPVTEDIYVADPADAKRLLDAGLEDAGLITVQRTQSLSEVGEPLISFTEKAEQYLLPVNDEKIQQVKVADEVIEEVTGIQMEDGENRAVVEYKTTFVNVSPFSKVSKIDLEKENVRKVNVVLYDDGWRIGNNRK
ncbi:hypothetical protein [Albibacterium bauzanense]|uniref:Uncharacterized protein n=1 Tax=Albibacterium bauzanense TaxID=653929 RepID=A0A4R1LQ49_9SPHI|nr:hypothetical protein [Albibacterium bauzanense]TCK80892.1 hypothetical protein C8N28_2646 [Albibacterium bauzanense]